MKQSYLQHELSPITNDGAGYLTTYMSSIWEVPADTLNLLCYKTNDALLSKIATSL